MTGTYVIDCHVLVLPSTDPVWAAELQADLDAEPVNQHWTRGIEDGLGRARAQGFALGSAPFVSFADPDDRILPGTFAALLQALESNPSAPFAWAGEQQVDERLRPIGRPHVFPLGHDVRAQRNSAFYVHGVVLCRRSVLEPLLPVLRQVGNGGESVIWAHAARLGASLSADSHPVHLPIVGRLWRQHPDAYHFRFAPTDEKLNAGLRPPPQYLHVKRGAGTAPCRTCGPPR